MPRLVIGFSIFEYSTIERVCGRLLRSRRSRSLCRHRRFFCHYLRHRYCRGTCYHLCRFSRLCHRSFCRICRICHRNCFRHCQCRRHYRRSMDIYFIVVFFYFVFVVVFVVAVVFAADVLAVVLIVFVFFIVSCFCQHLSWSSYLLSLSYLPSLYLSYSLTCLSLSLSSMSFSSCRRLFRRIDGRLRFYVRLFVSVIVFQLSGY